MGCGSSSLKGEQPTGLGSSDQPQPIRKVATNFSTVDYDQDRGNKKRRMTEYAPEDTIRNKSEVSTVPPALSGVGRNSHGDDQGPGGEKLELEPYQTMGSTDRGYPHEKMTPSGAGAASSSGATQGYEDVNGFGRGSDPTSAQAKDQFAETNEPAHNNNSGLAPPDDGEKKRKGSWLDRFKEGRREEISDEDMKKVSSS